MSVNNIEGSTMLFNKHGAIHSIIFLGPEKWRTKYFKIKAIVPKKKIILALFFSYYPLLQTLSILLLGSTRYLGIFGASYKIISLGPKRLFKTHVFWKKAIFSVKKCICSIFFRFVECDKPQETIYRIQKDVLRISVEVKRSFFRTWDVVESTTFWKKKRLFFQWKSSYANHLSYYRL